MATFQQAEKDKQTERQKDRKVEAKHQSMSKRLYLDVKIFFGRITHPLDPEIRKMLAKGLHAYKNSTFHSSP